MIKLEVEQSCLLELIKASLFDISPTFPDEVKWENVFNLANAQRIVPLTVPYVPNDYINEWTSITYQNKAFFMRLLYEQQLLVNLFEKYDIPIIIIKGTSAAIYYPVPSLRSFGDIDFYLPEEYFDFARELLEQNGYLFVKNDEREYIFNKNGIIFELHLKFSSKHYNDIEHLLLSGTNNAIEYKIGNFYFPGLPTYENGLVLLGHIMQHLKASGIGLRQIIDWMMFVYQKIDDTAWNNHFRGLAFEAGLEKLAITTTYMCKKWLGLPNEITWCNSADDYVADQLLVRILNEGNFGSSSSFRDSLTRNVKNMGLFTYLQRSGIDNWHLAQNNRFLRPFAWLYQLCRYVCLGIVGLFTGKIIFGKENQYLKLEELLKKLE